MEYQYIKPSSSTSPDMMLLKEQFIDLLLQSGYKNHCDVQEFKKPLGLRTENDFFAKIVIARSVDSKYHWNIPFLFFCIDETDGPLRNCNQMQAVKLGAEGLLEFVEQAIAETARTGLTNWKELILERMEENGDRWDNVECVTISEDELLRLFEASRYQKEGKPFTLWTKDYVYFALSYDSSESVACVPRNPCDVSVYLDASEN